jgi:hypothetical protein
VRKCELDHVTHRYAILFQLELLSAWPDCAPLDDALLSELRRHLRALMDLRGEGFVHRLEDRVWRGEL